MDVVLDLDLDYFVWPRVQNPPDEQRRMDEASVEHLASVEDVRRFLTHQCRLGERPILSREVETHEGAFLVWRDWIRGGHLSVPFRVVHVDAHADLGSGATGNDYLATELLAQPVDQRSEPRTGDEGMNEANYLLFALANRWIADLTFVYNVEPRAVTEAWAQRVRLPRKEAIEAYRRRNEPSDLSNLWFSDWDPSSGLLELKHYRTIRDLRERREPARREPTCRFAVIPGTKFSFEGFTHTTLARSPRYTPPSADALLPVIREFGRLTDR